MTLYNAKSGDGKMTITKFDDDMNPIDSYDLVMEPGKGPTAPGWQCNCPASVPVCRHVKMLAIFTGTKTVNKPSFLNYDTREWVHLPEDPV